jgi:predicted ATPase/class 3 adenylate cyclase
MHQLPIGTVTFLFTDIEGSTRLVRQLGDQFGAVLERHHSTLRDSIRGFRGVEVSTEGDAFFAVFTSAMDAVHAATSAQRALAAAVPMDGSIVRVRMGLHTGVGQLGGDNYIGLDVHRAARIAAAGHGGQVLLSDATRALVEPELPPDIHLRDLGRHRLRDLEFPEHLHQLVIDDLPAEFPALRTAEVPPTNLVMPGTPLIGRARELAEASALLDQNRLVTLTGPGGIGKTRIATELGARRTGRLGDGVFLVQLETFTERALVSGAIAQALGVRVPPQVDTEEALRGFLAPRDLLLILDNFEQVPSAAPLVTGLLAGCPNLRVLVTSRVPLHVSSEQEYPLGPLALPPAGGTTGPDDVARIEAVALFVDRARRARPSFALSAENGAAVAAICRRLDGLPLAIELAAARIKILSPEAILSRLENALSLLTGGNVDLPDRQRTLRAAIEWSVRLLEPDEQVLFRELSVFAGGWNLVAAQQVTSGDTSTPVDVLDRMSVLVDQNLVRSSAEDGGAETRFDMLLLIREYGLEQLAASADGLALGRRHAEWMLSVVETAAPLLEAGADPRALDVVVVEHDNLRAALRWCVVQDERELGLRLASDAWRFWQQTGHTAEGRAWFDRLMPSAAEAELVDPAVLAAAHTAIGGLAYWQNEIAVAEQHYQVALALDQQLGRSDRLGDDIYNLGFAAMNGGDLELARQLFAEALELFTAAGQRARIADSTSVRGAIELRAGNLAEARDWMERGRALQVAIGNRLRAIDNALVLSQICIRLGDLVAAHRWLLLAMDEARAVGDVARWPLILEVGATLALAADHPRDALLLGTSATRVRVKLGGGPPAFNVDMESVDARAREAVQAQLGDDAVEQTVAESAYLDNEALAALLRAVGAPGG